MAAKYYVLLGAVVVLLAAAAFILVPVDHDSTIRDWQRRTTRLVVETTGPGRGQGRVKSTTELTSRDDIDALLGLIRTDRRSRFVVVTCACLGNPHLQLYEGDRHIAAVSVHHGYTIRCEKLCRSDLEIEAQLVPALIDYFARLDMREYVERRDSGL